MADIKGYNGIHRAMGGLGGAASPAARPIGGTLPRETRKELRMSDPTPITVLVLEPELAGITAEQLAREHEADIESDYLGRACLPRPVARRVLDDYRRQRDRLSAERAERSAEARRRSDNVAQRRQAEAIRERDRAALAVDPTLSAFELMLVRDTESAMDRAGERNARLRSGQSWGGTFRRT